MSIKGVKKPILWEKDQMCLKQCPSCGRHLGRDVIRKQKAGIPCMCKKCGRLIPGHLKKTYMQ